jgi:predicted flap endonuclease-1-like 5' DNA nuclease
MLYLIGQIGLILAVAALLFFALGYWYGRHKSTEKENPLVFEKGSVTAAAVAVLEEKIQQKDRQISLLQEQMADLEAGFTRKRSEEEVPELVHADTHEGNPGGTQEDAAHDSAEAVTLTPAGGDDLTRMRGIGKALQAQLNGLGINSFEQIAQWGKEDIKEFAAKLALKDRIRRDNWVTQAKKLKA